MSKEIPLPKGWKWSDMMLSEHNVKVNYNEKQIIFTPRDIEMLLITCVNI